MEAKQIVDRLNAMSQEEKLEAGKQAYLFCLEHNLFFKDKNRDELAELKQHPARLMMECVLRKELWLRAHPEAKEERIAKGIQSIMTGV